MKKYILPIVLGAGAIFYFLRQNKENEMPDRTDKFNEVKQPLETTQSSPKKPKLKKSFDINKAIDNVSKLKNSKGGQIVQKAIKSKLAKKKSKITS